MSYIKVRQKKKILSQKSLKVEVKYFVIFILYIEIFNLLSKGLHGAEVATCDFKRESCGFDSH